MEAQKTTNAQGSDVLTKSAYITVTEPGSVNYCESASLSDTDEYISNVAIGSFNNSSGASMYTYYENNVITMSQGANLSVTLTPTFIGKAQREFWRIWVDFNQDGDFDDSDETVLVQNNQKSEVTGNLSIPNTALLGNTRMRITMKRGGSPSSCETFSIGEVEDYKVSIVQPKIAFGGEKSIFTFSIYPNPANERVNLLIEGLNDFKLNIFNSAGELMYEKIGKSGSTEINTSDFPSGVFYIRIRSGLDQFVEKFIKI